MSSHHYTHTLSLETVIAIIRDLKKRPESWQRGTWEYNRLWALEKELKKRVTKQ